MRSGAKRCNGDMAGQWLEVGIELHAYDKGDGSVNVYFSDHLEMVCEWASSFGCSFWCGASRM